jgi:hypothetical protein
MSRSFCTPHVKQGGFRRPSPIPISRILLAVGIGLLAGQQDGKAQEVEPDAAPNLTMDSTGKFYAKNDTLWFPTGPGDPEDFLCRSATERRSIVDRLNGGNTLYVMAVKTHGGDGPAGCNPWISGNPTKGLDTAKLNDWYSALVQADNKGVVIHFFIYDDDSCPWGAKKDCEERNQLLTDEGDFLDAFVDRFKSLSNLVWVVAEEYSEAVRSTRANAIAARIQSRDRVHPVGIHQLSRDTSFNFPNNKNFVVFLMQIGNKLRSSGAVHDTIAKEYNAAAGRYAVVLAELNWHLDLLDAGDRTNLRRLNWAAAMGGAAGTLVFGTWASQVTPPTQSMLDDMYRIHALLKGNDKSDLSNSDSRKSGTTLYVRRNSKDSKMLVYSENCTKLPYPGVIRLASGTFRATWMDTVDGTTATQTISSNGGGHNFGVPPSGIGAECVIWVRP